MNHPMLQNASQRQYIKYIFSLLLFLVISSSAIAKEGGAVSIVYKLYKDYAWEILLSDFPKNDRELSGKSFEWQPKNILTRYLDNELANLFIRDQNCIKKNPGELCKLEFSPIWNSQDPAAYDMKITDEGKGRVNVEYVYPSNQQKIKLSFYVRQTETGWRIFDICYEDGSCLKKILGNH